MFSKMIYSSSGVILFRLEKMSDLNCKLLSHKLKYFVPHFSCFSLSYTNLRLFHFVHVKSPAKVRRKLAL